MGFGAIFGLMKDTPLELLQLVELDGNYGFSGIINGQPTIDMLGVDPRRFGPYATKEYLIKKIKKLMLTFLQFTILMKKDQLEDP